MPADIPGEIVGELIAPLCALDVGVRLAAKVCKSCDVNRRVRAAGNIRVVEVREASSRILKAEFVDLVVADRPGVLRGAGDIAKGLLRSPRVGVLSEGLILRR